MTRAILIAAAAALLAGPSYAKVTYRVLAGEEQLAAFVDPIKAQAKDFAAADDDQALAVNVASTKNIQYHPELADAVSKLLLARQDNALAEMYTNCQLLVPLTISKTDVLVKLRPAMVELLDRYRYQPMPEPSAKELADLAPVPPGLSKAEAERRNQKRSAAIAQKGKAERAATKHNRAVAVLEKQLKGLLLSSDDAQSDQAMLDRLAHEQAFRWLSFEETLRVIKDEAGKMKQDRAKHFYDGLKDLASKQTVPTAYTDPTSPTYSETAASSFAVQQKRFDVAALQVVNVLATSAQQPAVVVPTEPGRKPGRKSH